MALLLATALIIPPLLNADQIASVVYLSEWTGENVSAVDASSGKEMFRWLPDNSASMSSTVTSDGSTWYSSWCQELDPSDRFSMATHGINAVDAVTGTIKWRFVAPEASNHGPPYGAEEAAPVVSTINDEDAIFWSNMRAGMIYRLDESGRVAWTFNCSAIVGRRDCRLGKLTMSPSGVLVTPRMSLNEEVEKSEGASILGIDQTTGLLLWNLPLEADIDLDGPLEGSGGLPSVSFPGDEDVCYMVTRGAHFRSLLWAVRGEDGRVISKAPVVPHYTVLKNFNAWAGHGALFDIDQDETAAKNTTAKECQAVCEADSRCGCAVRNTSDGTCWRRGNCLTAEMERGYYEVHVNNDRTPVQDFRTYNDSTIMPDPSMELTSYYYMDSDQDAPDGLSEEECQKYCDEYALTLSPSAKSGRCSHAMYRRADGKCWRTQFHISPMGSFSLNRTVGTQVFESHDDVVAQRILKPPQSAVAGQPLVVSSRYGIDTSTMKVKWSSDEFGFHFSTIAVKDDLGFVALSPWQHQEKIQITSFEAGSGQRRQTFDLNVTGCQPGPVLHCRNTQCHASNSIAFGPVLTADEQTLVISFHTGCANPAAFSTIGVDVVTGSLSWSKEGRVVAVAPKPSGVLVV